MPFYSQLYYVSFHVLYYFFLSLTLRYTYLIFSSISVKFNTSVLLLDSHRYNALLQHIWVMFDPSLSISPFSLLFYCGYKVVIDNNVSAHLTTICWLCSSSYSTSHGFKCFHKLHIFVILSPLPCFVKNTVMFIIAVCSPTPFLCSCHYPLLTMLSVIFCPMQIQTFPQTPHFYNSLPSPMLSQRHFDKDIHCSHPLSNHPW